MEGYDCIALIGSFIVYALNKKNLKDTVKETVKQAIDESKKDNRSTSSPRHKQPAYSFGFKITEASYSMFFSIISFSFIVIPYTL